MESQRVEFHARTIWDSTAPFYWIAINPIYRTFISNHRLKYKINNNSYKIGKYVYIFHNISKFCARVFFFLFYKISRYSFIYFRICWIVPAQRVYKIMCFYFLSYNVDEIRYKLQFYGRLHFFVFVWFKTILWNIQIVYQYRSHCSYIILTDKIF